MREGAKPKTVSADSGTKVWPLWRALYAQGDPLPVLPRVTRRSAHRFDEGDALPEEYRRLLVKMIRREGERAGNKSFLNLMAGCIELADTLYPTQELKVLKAEYVAEELKHAIQFHRLALALEPALALRDAPYTHYALRLDRGSWVDDAFFHFFMDLTGAFYAREWVQSSYVPLARLAPAIERDEVGHSELGYHLLSRICAEGPGRELAQRLLAKWYPAALDVWGRSDSPSMPTLIRWGLKNVENEAMRQAYQQYVDPKLQALGLELPDPRAQRLFL